MTEVKCLVITTSIPKHIYLSSTSFRYVGTDLLSDYYWVYVSDQDAKSTDDFKRAYINGYEAGFNNMAEVRKGEENVLGTNHLMF